MPKTESAIDIKNIVSLAKSELAPAESEKVIRKMMGLFRLRLQQPYFIEIYHQLYWVTENLGNNYPNTKVALRELIFGIKDNEKDGFRLLIASGIDLLSKPSEEEEILLKTVSGHLPKSVKTATVAGFFEIE